MNKKIEGGHIVNIGFEEIKYLEKGPTHRNIFIEYNNSSQIVLLELNENNSMMRKWWQQRSKETGWFSRKSINYKGKINETILKEFAKFTFKPKGLGQKQPFYRITNRIKIIATLCYYEIIKSNE